MNKVDKSTLIPIGLALAIAMFATTLASKTSSRFVSLEKDIGYYMRNVDDLVLEVRELKHEVRGLRTEIIQLEKERK